MSDVLDSLLCVTRRFEFQHQKRSVVILREVKTYHGPHTFFACDFVHIPNAILGKHVDMVMLVRIYLSWAAGALYEIFT